MQNQRSSFVRQPARILLVDLTKPFDITTCGILKESLGHFFSLTCSISGPCRVPFFGLFALGSYPEALFPLQNLTGNYVRLQNSLRELEICVGNIRGNTDAQSSITQGIREATNMFKRQAQNLLQTAGYWAQLEVTIITCQTPSHVIRQVDKASQDITMESLKKVQVLHINTYDRTRGSEVREGADSPDISSPEKSQTSESGLVDWLSLDEDVFCLENFFKGWLQDCSTDMEQLHLHFPPAEGNDLVLKCDLRERLLSPQQLPLAEKFLIRCDNPLTNKVTSQGVNKGPAGQQEASLYNLHVVQRLSADSICESVLYDMPLVVRPTSCWKMEWDDLEINHQHFTALCHLLKDNEEVLLAVLEEEVPPIKKTCGFRYQVAAPILRPHFILLPALTGALLLKPLAVNELIMPCEFGGGDKPTEQSLHVLAQCLDKVSKGAGYNPLTSSSNLYQCLESRLVKPSAPGGGVGGRRPGLEPTGGVGGALGGGGGAVAVGGGVIQPGSKRRGAVIYPTAFQPASSALVRPQGLVKASNFSSSSTPAADTGGHSPPPVRPRSRAASHNTLVSGRDFYGKHSEFPTEL